ncbi:MAG: hypothetical protein Q8Q89_02590 [bacterium]|nr:hypothetical protein [bacterium]
MTLTQVWVFIAIIVALAFFVVKVLEFIEKDAQKTWWIVVDGIYIQSIPQQVGSKIATGMTGHYAKLPPVVWNTLVFKNGARIKVINIEELPPPGTYIRVLKNNRAEFKIETPDIPPSSCL